MDLFILLFLFILLCKIILLTIYLKNKYKLNDVISDVDVEQFILQMS